MSGNHVFNESLKLIKSVKICMYEVREVYVHFNFPTLIVYFKHTFGFAIIFHKANYLF